MKTIAITIDDETLRRVDALAGGEARRNRSRLIRQAVEEYVARLERQAADAREAATVRKHRRRLSREVSALMREQARP